MSMLPGRERALHARERWPDDWYVEPAWSVDLLFDHVRFSGAIHDPCCGCGTIPKVAAARGYFAGGSDLVDRGFGEAPVDFLQDFTRRDNLVFNAPYRLNEPFIAHALDRSDRGVAALVRMPFLAGQRRLQTLFGKIPPESVVVLSRRPSMPPGGTDIPAKGGTTDYAWIVWRRPYDNSRITSLRWAA